MQPYIHFATVHKKEHAVCSTVYGPQLDRPN